MFKSSTASWRRISCERDASVLPRRSRLIQDVRPIGGTTSSPCISTARFPHPAAASRPAIAARALPLLFSHEPFQRIRLCAGRRPSAACVRISIDEFSTASRATAIFERRNHGHSVQPRRDFRRIAHPVAMFHRGNRDFLQHFLDGLPFAQASQRHRAQPAPVLDQGRLPIDATGRGLASLCVSSPVAMAKWIVAAAAGVLCEKMGRCEKNIAGNRVRNDWRPPALTFGRVSPAKPLAGAASIGRTTALFQLRTPPG